MNIPTEQTIAFLLCAAIFAIPAAQWLLTRRPGESPRRWLQRYEPVDWPDLHRRLCAGRWISPAWWGRHMVGVILTTTIIPSAMALFALVSGEWRRPGAVVELGQLWFELTLVISVPLYLRIMQSHQPRPRVLSWDLLIRWPQVMAYALAALQIYGVLIPDIQLTGLRNLLLLR